MAPDSLQQIAPQLSHRLRGETVEKLRTVALVVCRLAVERTGLDAQIVGATLEQLETGTDVPMSAKMELEAMMQDFDLRYYELNKAAGEGRATSDDVDAAFEKARAVAAVLAACADDAFVAATESTYEAWAAVNHDLGTIRNLVEGVLAASRHRKSPQTS